MVKDRAALADLTFVQRPPQTLINVGGAPRGRFHEPGRRGRRGRRRGSPADTGRASSLRPSGTGAPVRVMVEAATQEEADSVASSLADGRREGTPGAVNA